MVLGPRSALFLLTFALTVLRQNIQVERTDFVDGCKLGGATWKLRNYFQCLCHLSEPLSITDIVIRLLTTL